MPSAWNMFVKKIFEEGQKINGKTYKFSQALQDASKRKAEMGVGAVKTVANKLTSSVKNVTKKRGKNNSKKEKNEDDAEQEENKKKKRKSKKRSMKKRKSRKNKSKKRKSKK